MAKLSSTQKAFLLEAARSYWTDLEGSPAEEYLVSRGVLGPEAENPYLLGYVGDPLPGHDMYRGMIAIPYMRQAADGRRSVVSIRFRCFVEGCEHEYHGKYNTVSGDKPRLYNTRALQTEEDRIGITEGEFDAVVASNIGIPSVSVPGAQSWQRHFREPFLGYEIVYIFADGDQPGMQFARSIAQTLPNAKVIPCPDGEDVSSLVLQHGPDSILGRID